METTMQPLQESWIQRIRSSIALIEVIELSILTLAFTVFIFLSGDGADAAIWITVFFLFEAVVLGSWLIYNAFIRITRGGRGGQPRNIRTIIGLGILTSGYVPLTWAFLDVNRWLVSKFLYQGEPPVEYAWSLHSRNVRKVWEEAKKAANG